MWSAVPLVILTGVTAWYSSASVDPLTDQRRVTVVGEIASGPALCVRLTQTELSLYISTSFVLGHGTVPVTWRFDSEDPVTLNWTVSTGRRSAFYPDDSWTALRAILRSERVVVGFTPPGHNRKVFTFHTEGLREELVSAGFPMMFLTGGER